MHTAALYLKDYVLGASLSREDFELRERPLRELREGDVKLRTLALSVDPYMRGRMTGLPNFYIPQFELSEPIHSVGVAQVVESRLSGYSPGDIVLGGLDWTETSILGSEEIAQRMVGGGVLRNLGANVSDPYLYLGALGINGVTAFFGVVGAVRPRRGETLVMSSAAGGVGSIAGQIAKILGCRVVGLAGSEEKRHLVTNELGFDHALDYRSPRLGEELLELFPSGPDIYFDNVGGDVSQTIMSIMYRPARVIECGQISTYDDPDGGWKVDIRPIHRNGLRFESFTPSQFREFLPAAEAQLAHWVQAGQIKALESRTHGLDSAAIGLLDLFRGRNVGKAIVIIGEGPDWLVDGAERE